MDFYSIVEIITVNNINLLIFEVYLAFVLTYRKVIEFLSYEDNKIIVIIYFIKFLNK